MFAIALWDARARRLWLIRDRIGIKPLYYSIHHGRITLLRKSRLSLGSDQVRAVNEEALFHYLSFITTPAPDTLFAGIHKLPPGSFLTMTRTARAAKTVLGRSGSHHAADRRFRRRDRRAAACGTANQRGSAYGQRRSGGVFLSGGIDSSTNTALFSSAPQGRSRHFPSDTTKIPRLPKRIAASQEFAAHIGAAHHERVLTQQDFLDFLPRMIHLQDEPIADPVCMPVYFLSKLARDHGVIVAQAGEGADELFWGYEIGSKP